MIQIDVWNCSLRIQYTLFNFLSYVQLHHSLAKLTIKETLCGLPLPSDVLPVSVISHSLTKSLCMLRCASLACWRTSASRREWVRFIWFTADWEFWLMLFNRLLFYVARYSLISTRLSPFAAIFSLLAAPSSLHAAHSSSSFSLLVACWSLDATLKLLLLAACYSALFSRVAFPCLFSSLAVCCTLYALCCLVCALDSSLVESLLLFCCSRPLLVARFSLCFLFFAV